MKLPFEIVEVASFLVVGYRIKTTNKNKEGSKRIPEYWTTFIGRDK